MKKTLSIILVVMMLMSLFTTTAFAAGFNSYVVSNVEGFETGKGGEGGGGTTEVAYPNITAEIGTHPGSSSDNTKVMKVVANTDEKKAAATMIVGKVTSFNNASYFEEGAKYRYTAWVKYVPNSTATATEISFKIYPLKENSTSAYTGTTNNDSVTIPVNEWVKVETKPFTYSNTKGQTFANLRTQLTTAKGSTTDYDVYYLDDVELEKCEDGFIPGKKYDFEEFASVDNANMFSSYNGKDYVIENTINNYPYITSIDNQKALKMKTSNNGYGNLNARYLFKMFGTKDVGKNYKVTMKIKAVKDNPNGVANVGTGTPRVFVGIKKNTSNAAGYGANYYPDRTVTASGALPKYVDLSYTNWTDVEFYVNPQTDYNYISLSLEGDKTPVANAPMYICVDDILAEEIPELPNKSIFEKNVVQNFESATNLVKGIDYLVDNDGVVELYEGTQSDGTTGKYLKLTNTGEFTRNHLIGFINSTDVGKYYKLTMDIKADQATNVTVGFKTSVGSQTAGFAQGAKNLSVDTTWQKVSFNMAIAKDANGVQDRLCFNQATTGAIIYVDNIFVEPISSMSIFSPGTTYDFTNNGNDIHTGKDSETDNVRFYESTDYSIENYFDNIPTVTSEVDSQNSLRLKMSNNSYTHRKGRYTLKFFGKEDFGKFYRVSMKVKAVLDNPNKVDKVGTGTPLVCIGLKGYNGTATKANYGDNYFSDRTYKKAGTAPTPTSLTYDKWTNVELYVKPESGRDGICFALESCAVANSPMYIYIDDLRVDAAPDFTPYTSVFKGLADPSQRKTFDIDGTAYSTLALGTDFTSGGDFEGGIALETDAENNKYLKLGAFAADSKNNKRVKLFDVFSDAQLNETYKVSFKLKTAGNNATGSNLIYYGVMSDEDYSTKCQLSKTIGNTDWTSVEFIYTVTNDSKGNKMDEIFVEQLSKGSVQYVLLDDLVIEPVNNAYAISNYYTDDTRNNDKMLVKATTDTRADSADLIIIAVYSDKAEQNLVSAGVADYDADASLLTALLNNYNQIDSVNKIKVFYLNNNGDVISSAALSAASTVIAK